MPLINLWISLALAASLPVDQMVNTAKVEFKKAKNVDVLNSLKTKLEGEIEKLSQQDNALEDPNYLRAIDYKVALDFIFSENWAKVSSGQCQDKRRDIIFFYNPGKSQKKKFSPMGQVALDFLAIICSDNSLARRPY